MQSQGVQAVIIPSTDPHAGEYVPAHWESRKWISGFTGSAGTVVVTQHSAGLWTDSRYFLQAESQIQDSGIQLFKEKLPDTPSIVAWLGSVLLPSDKVGIDGWVFTHADAEPLANDLAGYHIQLTTIPDPFDAIWTDRPPLPSSLIHILPLQFSGKSCEDKLDIIRATFAQSPCDGILLSALDEIAWTLNLRGSDVCCNPVFISYLFIGKRHATLFVQNDKLTSETKQYLKDNNIVTLPYTAINQFLTDFPWTGEAWLTSSINQTLYETCKRQASTTIVNSPVAILKAVKNEVEIAGFHCAMERDGVALVRFLRWLKASIPTGKETELSISQKLTQLRSQQEHYKGISFETIAGYGPHAAIVHYEATDDTNASLQPKGLLLLDSGAQYLDGTTDITRTIPLGPLTDEEKTDYTWVLKGHLQLQNATFPAGTCGTQIDVLARQALWKAHINYLHGTGHGIGHYLCVHEGPHQIRMNYVPTPLSPGMIVTNEPGVYKSGRHGIRIENTLLVVPDGESEFGKFYKFEPLTLCPIDKGAIFAALLSEEERRWLNAYHQMVYERLSPLLTPEESEWLQQQCSPI